MAGAFADHAAGLGVHFPPVLRQVGEAKEAFNQVARQLHKDSEIGHAGDDALEALPQLLLEQREQIHQLQLAPGVFRAALVGAAVLAKCLDRGALRRGLAAVAFVPRLPAPVSIRQSLGGPLPGKAGKRGGKYRKVREVGKEALWGKG